MLRYREILPPPRLADAVECFWTMHSGEGTPVMHRVLPDGCADILFSFSEEKPTLHFVGPMSRFADVTVKPKEPFIGVRFRPGMWSPQIALPGGQAADQIVALEDLWGARARKLQEQIGESQREEGLALLANALLSTGKRSPVQQALGFLEHQHGCMPIKELARQAGLSVRQFRRLCIQETGLRPNLLARILRFRYASGRIHSARGDHAGLAADCGYADQSHFIAESRRFSGRTPAVSYRGVESGCRRHPPGQILGIDLSHQ